MGLDVEIEHGRRDPETDVTHDDPIVTGKIAFAHLSEFPDYYTKLAKIEAGASRPGRSRRDSLRASGCHRDQTAMDNASASKRDPAERSAHMRLFYRDWRPTRLGRVVNRVWSWWAGLGLPPRILVTLEAPGRNSGRTRANVLPMRSSERNSTSFSPFVPPLRSTGVVALYSGVDASTAWSVNRSGDD